MKKGNKAKKGPTVLERVMAALKARPEGYFQVELTKEIGCAHYSVYQVVRDQVALGQLKKETVLKSCCCQTFVSLPEGSLEPIKKPKAMSLIEAHLHTLRHFPNRHAWSINMRERNHG